VWVPAEPAGEPTDFFGVQPVQTSLAGTYFQPRISTMVYDTAIGAGDMHYQSGDNFADAHLDLPSGVILDSFRWWANDTVAGDAVYFFVQTCLPAAGPGAPVNTVLGGTGTTGTGGEQSGVITLPSIVVDNNTCSYFARVRFDAANLVNRRARLQWHRQVSAAPAVATFADVPTSHPFFRFVEALAAAGITGGCGGGNYCPNGGLTRGEMAVFLSTALGLHFPN
jgi:hypothetical protein